jgi:sugar phosphate permease
MAYIYNTIGLSAESFTGVIGYINIGIISGLLYPRTRRFTAIISMIWIVLGLWGRWKTNRSIIPPLTVIMTLAVAAV